MTTYEQITLLAILAGPVLAVAVQLLAERRKQVRDQQTATMRMLLSTRHMPADPSYCTAINMIPIDFNKVRTVMAAHRDYVEVVNFRPTEENRAQHHDQMLTRQTKLIFAMSNYLGYSLPETDIQTTAYASGGLIERDMLMLDAWKSWPRIANALETQTSAIFPQNPDQTGGKN